MIRHSMHPAKTIAGGVILLLSLLFPVTVSWIAAMTQPNQPQPAASRSVTVDDVQDPNLARYRLNDREHLFGQYEDHGMVILWKGNTSSGATIEDVVDAAVHRLQFEQTTDLASPDKARALIDLMRARDALAGRPPAETPDGTPIIE